MPILSRVVFIQIHLLRNAAEVNGKLAGSNFTTNWGSVGFFGPLTIHPEYWNQGIAQKLLEPTLELFDKWNTKHAGLFTFANSPKYRSISKIWLLATFSHSGYV